MVWECRCDHRAIIGSAMHAAAVEPPGAAAERVVAHTRASATQLASVLSRTAGTQAGRSDDAAEERRAAGRAREAARKARSHAEEWAELAAGRKP